MDDGTMLRDKTDILNKLEQDFSQLLSQTNGNYDENFLIETQFNTFNR